MAQVSRRSRWGLFTLVLAIVLGAGGLLGYRFWPRRASGPLAEGYAAYDRGDWETASNLARARLKTARDDPDAIRLLARSAARLGRDESSRALFGRLRALATRKDDPQLGELSAFESEDLYLVGRMLSRSGDQRGALNCWELGLRVAPDNAEMLDELVRAYASSRALALAAKSAQRLASLPGWEARGNLLLGMFRLEMDDLSGAADCLGRALERDPSARGAAHPAVYYRKVLARALLRLGRAAEARSQLRQVLAAGADAEASWLLSRAAIQDGNTAEAAEALAQSGSYGDEHPLAPEPSPFVGSARCAECHRAIYQAQQSSLHARTFELAADLKSLPLPEHPVADRGDPRVTHEIKREAGSLRFETHAEGKLATALVDFAFGSGDRGLTLVGHDEQNRVRELRLSRYAEGSGWDVTSGHPVHPPAREGYLGRFLTADDIRDCFFCHTTDGKSAREGTGPTAADHAIGCEQCHGPGGNHLRAVADKLPDLAIARPSAGSGQEIVALCAQCHSPRGMEVTPSTPAVDRFQGTTLTWSRCYTESNGALSCVTCHDPHHNASKSTAHYESKCLECHTAPTASQAKTETKATKRPTVCPVSPAKGCIGCHMPVVKPDVPHSTFTDHHIRRPAFGRRRK